VAIQKGKSHGLTPKFHMRCFSEKLKMEREVAVTSEVRDVLFYELM